MSNKARTHEEKEAAKMQLAGGAVDRAKILDALAMLRPFMQAAVDKGECHHAMVLALKRFERMEVNGELVWPGVTDNYCPDWLYKLAAEYVLKAQKIPASGYELWLEKMQCHLYYELLKEIEKKAIFESPQIRPDAGNFNQPTKINSFQLLTEFMGRAGSKSRAAGTYKQWIEKDKAGEIKPLIKALMPVCFEHFILFGCDPVRLLEQFKEGPETLKIDRELDLAWRYFDEGAHDEYADEDETDPE